MRPHILILRPVSDRRASGPRVYSLTVPTITPRLPALENEITLHPVDVAVLAVCFAAMIGIGVAVVRRASRSLDHYFLAGNALPWYVLGVSNASAMFDITGTMWLVYNVFVYGLKGIWLPWLWPTFNQVFMMVYLSAWIRRSNALTGAEWITSRFGEGRGAEFSRAIVVLFAVVSVVGFIPLYMVVRDMKGLGISALILLVTSWVLKKTWYDKLEI